MSQVDAALLEDLKARGLLAQMTGEETLPEYLSAESRTLYCGFDPTADSLHIGSLVPLLTLRRFQQAGHKPIALVGGATGLIGDPSFKAQERKLNTAETVSGWVEKLRKQVSAFIEFNDEPNSAMVVNNLDWTQGMDVLTFLRDVGKHFSVNNMINKESVKQRIDREGEGISFTEFTYSLLQSFDFAELYKHHNCSLQIGGSDQFGNIIGGVELTRRRYGGKAYGLTLPLVTKADGTKFGKTESGTIWLDAGKTSPYAFYQFWLNTADADVYKFLKYFTFLPVADIDALEEKDKAAAGRPEAQGVLAIEVTRLVHGDEGLAAAERITKALFSGDADQLSAEDYQQLAQDGLPSYAIEAADLDEPLTSLLVKAGLAGSGKQVKDALQRRALLVNGKDYGADDNMGGAEIFSSDHARFGGYFLVRLGKKKYALLTRA
ncbi:tyrosine--tRNA ligase [Pseudoteredinibacter isoporae]|uniref:tyrosine--tRNA ligase n=1 Tax=Pseudoteredinibacter isoporae TaxID=570281 RepID=UPI00334288FE